MTLPQSLMTLITVLAISCGQLLFKLAGKEFQVSQVWFSLRVILPLLVAGTVYFGATLAWINLLRYVPLSKAYLFMSLSFIIVPLADYFFYHEHLSCGYMIGGLIVLIGLTTSVVFG